MSVAANGEQDTGWSRRRALQSAAAVLATAAVIAEHAPNAAAQSAEGSPARCHPYDPGRLQGRSPCRRSPELAIRPLQLAESDPGVAAGTIARRRRWVGGHQLAGRKQSDGGVGQVRRGRRRAAGLSECAPRTWDRSSHDSRLRQDGSWRRGGSGFGTTRRIRVRQAIVAEGEIERGRLRRARSAHGHQRQRNADSPRR